METNFKLSEDIRLKDVQIFLELVKTKSVRDLARRFGVAPGQISKTIKGLELKLGIQLFERSTYGVEVSPEALGIVPMLENIHQQYLKLEGELRPQKREDFLSFAASSFISTHLLPKVLADFQKDEVDSRFRLIDLPPGQFIPVALRGGFQLCVHMGDLDWPKTWTSIEVGSVNWNLYCRADHPIGKRPSLAHVLEQAFVYPVYWSNEGIRFGDDNCPLPIRKRKMGHETATATAAVEIVRCTDNLGFLPSLVCRPYLESGGLRKIKVKEWRSVTQKLYLTVKNDFIKQNTFIHLKNLLSDELKDL